MIRQSKENVNVEEGEKTEDGEGQRLTIILEGWVVYDRESRICLFKSDCSLSSLLLIHSAPFL